MARKNDYRLKGRTFICSEHKEGLIPGFTTKYRVTRLIHFEEFAEGRDAIAREKQLKDWRRSRKVQLVEERNPTWEDLAQNLSFLL